MRAVFAPNRTLAITSQNPSSGIPITVWTADRNGLKNGTTSFVRNYAQGDQVSVTAPAVQGTNYFARWDLDGSPWLGTKTVTVPMSGNRTLSAPTNAKSGQKGILWFAASISTRTLTLNAAWNLMTGVEAGPYSITTAQTLGIAYVVRGTTVYVTAILRIG